MTGFQADMFLLFKYIHAAGLFQFSNISSISHRLSKGGGEMLLLRSRIWIQSWLSCWQGAQEAPAQLTVGQSLCIALWDGICGVWVSIEALLGHWGERVEL